MKILGIGTDIVEIDRIEALLARHPERFAARILHANEYQRFTEVGNQAAWLAKRFATKEAVAKAFGSGIGKEVQLQEIETAHDARGKPLIHFHGTTLATAQALGVKSCEVSVADERRYAVAFVILSGE